MNTVQNPNIGRKIQFGTSAATAADKMRSQAESVANAATFAPVSVSSAPAEPIKKTPKRVKRREKTVLKGIYFDQDIYDRLMVLQDSGQNISRFISNLAREKLGFSFLT